MLRKAKNKSKSCLILLSVVFPLILLAGCEEKQKLQADKPILESTVQRENEKLAAENAQLKSQVETLMSIDKQARIDAISIASQIELTNRSGLYDKNDDGKKETLVVYLKTIDDMGDVVKAPGAVTVELWNLNAKPENALMGKWTVEPEKLKKSWSGSLMTNYYKLQFDLSSILTGNEPELTIKAEFTDYISGKILKSQVVSE